ncbi:MAG TPA: pilus assembly PilX N-terminal domain-containing protein [Candidatus Saccharimonadales bacterium]|nr:pilus assembly PilX N-terminal domain-containing protein [Candidatus Saccharimonadales bacterium]
MRRAPTATVRSPRALIRHSREAGVVSLMVTMVMMIVIALLVLGFAEISRNEQRSSLDDQLSVQAYYAAESGVNDARTAIQNLVQAGTTLQDKTLCGNQGAYNFSGTIDSQHSVSYTCVLIDASPTTLSYEAGYTSSVVPLISANGSNFNTVTLTWYLPTGATGGATGCYTNTSSLGQFPVAAGSGAWGCAYPVLQVDLLNANGGLSRNSWNTNTATMFFVPFNSSSVANTGSLAARGSVIGARCNATSCTATINGLSGTTYYMRVATLYRTGSRLDITAGGKSFAGAQATIDATGKAQDVLRRIKVAVDLTDANADTSPAAALEIEDSACKRFGVTSGSFAVYDDLSAGGDGNPLCTVQSSGTPQP